MLTNKLEELIAEGKAQFRTATLGGSGMMSLPIQDNCLYIITGFEYFHFLDLVRDLRNDYVSAMSRSVHTLKISSDKSGNYFNFKCPVRSVEFQGPGGRIYQTYGSTYVDTYLVHEEGNINFEIAVGGTPFQIQNNFADPLNNFDKIPAGYGNLADPGNSMPNVITGVFFPGLKDKYVAQYLRNNEQLPLQVGDPIDGFRIPFRSEYAFNPQSLQNGDVEEGAYALPLINVSYVKVLRRASYFTQSS